MAYVSLYRKYRPQTFADVVGQAHVTQTLVNALTEDRLHHAYLFTGPRGTGKTSTARILAKSLNCEQGPAGEPCNACAHCRQITDGSHMDVIEIDAASHGGVDDVRDLRDRVAFAPAAARTKVYIVDECHMLSTAGWNAFLKTVEEPPGHVLFVFATTEPHKVLSTILSRTQRFDFRRVGAADLAALVERLGRAEGFTFEPGAVDLIVRAGDGSARDTLSVLDQVVAFTGSAVTPEGVAAVLGTVPDALLAETTVALADGDVAGVCTLVQRLADQGQDLRQYARDAVEHLRRLFLLQVAPNAGLVDATPEHLVELQSQAARLGRTELLRAIELLAESQAQMRRGNTRLPLEIALVKAALPEASGDPAALAARMDRLERRGGVEPTARDESPAAEEPSAGPPPAAQPVETPGPPSVTEAPAEAELALVTRAWPAIMDGVRARKKTLHAFLGMGTPVALEDGVLVLEFGATWSLHAERCESPASQRLITGVIAEVSGVRPRLRCRVTGDARAPDPVAESGTPPRGGASEFEDVMESEAAEDAGEVPDENEIHDRAIETLSRDLGATVVADER